MVGVHLLLKCLLCLPEFSVTLKIIARFYDDDDDDGKSGLLAKWMAMAKKMYSILNNNKNITTIFLSP